MQASFSELEYATKKTTRRDRFLSEREAITSWTELIAVIEPFYPAGEGRVVDVSLTSTPASTKNCKGVLTPTCIQPRKENNGI